MDDGDGTLAMRQNEAASRMADAAGDGGDPKPLTPAAKRALAEAAERRRREPPADPAAGIREVNGREGPEPVRYGDWEKNGIISDF